MDTHSPQIVGGAIAPTLFFLEKIGAIAPPTKIGAIAPPTKIGAIAPPTAIAPPKGPHSRDLRKGRYSQPGQVYLLTAKIQDRWPLLGEFANARGVIDALRRESRDGNALTIAFVVMPDHFHWLVLLQQGTLSALMARVKRRSVIRIAAGSGISPMRPVRRSDGTRRWWQEGFHDHALRSDESLLAAARYIVANPLRAGLCTRIGDYPHWDAAWLYGREYL